MTFTIEAKKFGKYDVLVCGGGTAGTIAAIAAARLGAKTLLVERTFTVGGMLTIGDAGITKFIEHCKDLDLHEKEVVDVLATDPTKVQVVGGIPREYVQRMIDAGTALGTHGQAGSYVFTDKCEAQWTLMDMLEEAGVEVLYDTRVCMTLMDGDTLTGVVVCNKDGFSEIYADRIIDATGDADVAMLAGVPHHVGASEYDLQEGAAEEVGQQQQPGTMYRVRDVDFDKLFAWLEANPNRYGVQRCAVMSLENVKRSYYSGEMCVFDILITDEPVIGFKHIQVYNLPTKGEAILLGPWCGMVGSVKADGLNARDISKGQALCQNGVRQMNNYLKRIPGFENMKTLYVPDIGIRETRHIIGEYVLTGIDVLSTRDFEDSIGCGGHPIDIYPIPEELEKMPMDHWRFHIPYRIMVPQKVENLLVTGRCVSATRAASGVLRPTAQCMVMGEAAGTAAVLSLKQNVPPKNVDIKELRSTLLNNGAVL